MSKKKINKKKKLHILLWIAAVLIIAGAAGYTLFIKPMMEQEEIIYKENTAQYGTLQNGVTESGTVEFGITSQVYDLDLTTDDDDDDDDDEEDEDYLKVEEVYVAVGQRITQGDPVYKFTQSSIDKVRKTLTYARMEAQIALNAREHLSYNSKSLGTITKLGHFRRAIATGSPVWIPYFFAGIDLATTIPVRFFGFPPTQEGISLRSGNPWLTLLADSQERNALFTSI